MRTINTTLCLCPTSGATGAAGFGGLSGGTGGFPVTPGFSATGGFSLGGGGGGGGALVRGSGLGGRLIVETCSRNDVRSESCLKKKKTCGCYFYQLYLLFLTSKYIVFHFLHYKYLIFFFSF